MGKHSRRADPGDPTQWIGQPYTPHDPYYYLTGPGRQRFPMQAMGVFGCAFIIVALTVGALIVVGLLQNSGPGFWALLILIGAASIGTLVGVASARHRHRIREAQRHLHHHKHG